MVQLNIYDQNSISGFLDAMLNFNVTALNLKTKYTILNYGADRKTIYFTRWIITSYICKTAVSPVR